MSAIKKRNFDYLVKTDAGIRGERSSHFYRIRKIEVKKNRQGKRYEVARKKIIHSQELKSFYSNIHHAELYSIETALLECRSQGLCNILVKTDSKIAMVLLNGEKPQNHKSITKLVYSIIAHNETIMRDVRSIQKLMKELNVTVQFDYRHQNTGADKRTKKVWQGEIKYRKLIKKETVKC